VLHNSRTNHKQWFDKKRKSLWMTLWEKTERDDRGKKGKLEKK
jgi:hypothetical protein